MAQSAASESTERYTEIASVLPHISSLPRHFIVHDEGDAAAAPLSEGRRRAENATRPYRE
jgi:hypothetical protein